MIRDRNTVEFNIYASYNIEKLTETLFSRIENLCTFITVLAGTSAFIEIVNIKFVALLIVVISIAQLVWKFGNISGLAEAQKQRYQVLLNRMPDLSDHELIDEFLRVQERDNRPLNSLEDIAYNKACYMRGQPEHCVKLGPVKAIVAFLSGANPCFVPKAAQQ